ncbi:signal peptidase I [Sphingomonas sp. NSE70-1]|uniref:Signal peptidase I n=1 Tax=Sphingomonas caseinilyticus TaxID=2908205 RepID=A0ABT0RSJ8_9SPHN|nr:signal peptidase I [Sphingomonas caseinilyticus]MCL6697985.1 signal peptidase I [Sphingomonas caseinilyticus]
MAFSPFRRRHYADPPSEDRRETAGGFFKSLLILAFAAWVLRSLIVAPFSIPSGSMLPTMRIGDYLFVSKWPYGYSSASFPFEFPPFKGRIFGSLPNRGDVVVFEGPLGQDVVKRVIGLPGDTIGVEGGQVILNGKPVPRERLTDFAMTVSSNSPCRVVPPAVPMTRPGDDGRPTCIYPMYRETLPNGVTYSVLDQTDISFADNFGPIRVPEGNLFLMGDNRDDSLDSRYPVIAGGMGFVPLDRVVGRAELAFWSTDGSASWINPLSWFTALRTERLATDYHP